MSITMEYFQMLILKNNKILKKSVKKSKRIFVYGHGHARTLCTYIQNELSAKQKETIICDVDFEKEYNFQDSDLLLLICINGNTFYYD